MRLQGQYLLSVIKIRSHRGEAAATILRRRGLGFLVTAKHAVEGILPGDRVYFRVGDGLSPLVAHQVGLGRHDDIAVLLIGQVGDDVGLPENLVDPLLTLGQPIVYCGFPLGLEGIAPEGHAWPMPIVKGGIYSGSVKFQEEIMTHLFDTVNNKGFSGGPVFAEGADRVPKLAAIVFGYWYDRDLNIHRIEADGSKTPLEDLVVRPNSGFMRAVPISRALELIEEMTQER